MAKDSDFLANLTDFLYPHHRYYGQFKPEYLVFNPHSADVTQIIDIFEKFQPGKFYLPNFSG
jgi:hypothetical protein